MPRVMEIVTPLGADALLFHGMTAREEMNGLSEYQPEWRDVTVRSITLAR